MSITIKDRAIPYCINSGDGSKGVLMMMMGYLGLEEEEGGEGLRGG